MYVEFNPAKHEDAFSRGRLFELLPGTRRGIRYISLEKVTTKEGLEAALALPYAFVVREEK